jgi:Amt family ammonium transporter
MGALAIGAASGVGCFFAATKLKRAMGYDDSLDAFGVHAIGGIIGALLTGVFASASLGGAGLAEGMSIGSQVGLQAIGVIATVIYTGIVSLILLKLIDVIIGLRVTDEEETEGLDITLHDERGYNL